MPEPTHTYAYRIVDVAPLGDLAGQGVLIGAPWEAHDHGEVPLLHPCGRDVEPAARTQRHVLLGVGCGVAIGISVDTEEAEVPRMAGIAPVVRVGTELTHRAGRCPHEADVRIDLLDEEQVLIPVVEGLDLQLDPLLPSLVALAVVAASQAVEVAGREELHARAALELTELSLDKGRDVLDLVDEGHHDTARGQLVPERPRPVALLEVVVLHAAELLDGIVAAVVIGQHEALRGDDLARTAAVEADDGVLERAAVGVV